MVLKDETKQNTLLLMKSVFKYNSKMVSFVLIFDILAYDFEKFMRLSIIVHCFSVPLPTLHSIFVGSLDNFGAR